MNHIDSPGAVGLRLQRARKDAGLSQRQLAFPGCTAAYISRIESGDRSPSLQMLTELAQRLNVRRDWLAMGYVDEANLDVHEELRLAKAEIARLQAIIDTR